MPESVQRVKTLSAPIDANQRVYLFTGLTYFWLHMLWLAKLILNFWLQAFGEHPPHLLNGKYV